MELWRSNLPARIPTEEEISRFDSLDERSAVEHFLGKSLAEGGLLFRDNGAYYSEDLMWMGPRAFNYYVQAAANYIRSSESQDDTFAVAGTVLAAETQLRNNRSEIDEVIPLIRGIVHYILLNLDKFDFEDDHARKFRSRCEQLLAELDAPVHHETLSPETIETIFQED